MASNIEQPLLARVLTVDSNFNFQCNLSFLPSEFNSTPIGEDFTVEKKEEREGQVTINSNPMKGQNSSVVQEKIEVVNKENSEVKEEAKEISSNGYQNSSVNPQYQPSKNYNTTKAPNSESEDEIQPSNSELKDESPNSYDSKK